MNKKEPLGGTRNLHEMAIIRAAARARATQNSDGRSPGLNVVFVGVSIELDCHRATVGDQEWLRESGESLTEFDKRVRAEMPVGGLPQMAIFWPDEDACTEDERKNAERE